jgi:BRCA1-associated protein
MVCGHIGCGRLANVHAYTHYCESGHPFALEIESQRVWDYASDKYVHRVIRHKDGDLVTVEPTEKSECYVSEQIEQLAEQMQHRFSTQLVETQQEYEGVLDRMEQKNIDYVSVLQGQMCELDVERVRVSRERDRLIRALRESESINAKQQHKIEKLHRKVEELERARQEEQILSQSVLENHRILQTQVTGLQEQLQQRDSEMNELKDQVRDLMFFIETLEKSKHDKELQEASVVGTSVPTKSPRKKKR